MQTPLRLWSSVLWIFTMALFAKVVEFYKEAAVVLSLAPSRYFHIIFRLYKGDTHSIIKKKKNE